MANGTTSLAFGSVLNIELLEMARRHTTTSLTVPTSCAGREDAKRRHCAIQALRSSSPSPTRASSQKRHTSDRSRHPVSTLPLTARKPPSAGDLPCVDRGTLFSPEESSDAFLHSNHIQSRRQQRLSSTPMTARSHSLSGACDMCHDRESSPQSRVARTASASCADAGRARTMAFDSPSKLVAQPGPGLGPLRQRRPRHVKALKIDTNMGCSETDNLCTRNTPSTSYSPCRSIDSRGSKTSTTPDAECGNHRNRRPSRLDPIMHFPRTPLEPVSVEQLPKDESQHDLDSLSCEESTVPDRRRLLTSEELDEQFDQQIANMQIDGASASCETWEVLLAQQDDEDLKLPQFTRMSIADQKVSTMEVVNVPSRGQGRIGNMVHSIARISANLAKIRSKTNEGDQMFFPDSKPMSSSDSRIEDSDSRAEQQALSAEQPGPLTDRSESESDLRT